METENKNIQFGKLREYTGDFDTFSAKRREALWERVNTQLPPVGSQSKGFLKTSAFKITTASFVAGIIASTVIVLSLDNDQQQVDNQNPRAKENIHITSSDSITVDSATANNPVQHTTIETPTVKEMLVEEVHPPNPLAPNTIVEEQRVEQPIQNLTIDTKDTISQTASVVAMPTDSTIVKQKEQKRIRKRVVVKSQRVIVTDSLGKTY